MRCCDAERHAYPAALSCAKRIVALRRRCRNCEPVAGHSRSAVPGPVHEEVAFAVGSERQWLVRRGTVWQLYEQSKCYAVGWNVTPVELPAKGDDAAPRKLSGSDRHADASGYVQLDGCRRRRQQAAATAVGGFNES